MRPYCGEELKFLTTEWLDLNENTELDTFNLYNVFKKQVSSMALYATLSMVLGFVSILKNEIVFKKQSRQLLLISS